MNNPKLTLEYFKRQAKKLKKALNTTHTQALDLVAKEHGYSNWKHCQRILSQQPIPEIKQVNEQSQLSFTDWLKRHKNRNSPLGDLAKDMLDDRTWPSHNTLGEYRDYLYSHNAYSGAIRALEVAWKSYKACLRRKDSPKAKKQGTPKLVVKNHDQRKIVYVSDATPIPFTERVVEKFGVGDKAWISWNGSKAIPVTILEVDDRYYTFKIERPLKKAGNEYYLRLDEVRSTPELACMNYVTL